MVSLDFENGDIPDNTLTADTWMHLGVTWGGPSHEFKTFIDGTFYATSTAGELPQRCFM